MSFFRSSFDTLGKLIAVGRTYVNNFTLSTWLINKRQLKACRLLAKVNIFCPLKLGCR